MHWATHSSDGGCAIRVHIKAHVAPRHASIEYAKHAAAPYDVAALNQLHGVARRSLWHQAAHNVMATMVIDTISTSVGIGHTGCSTTGPLRQGFPCSGTLT